MVIEQAFYEGRGAPGLQLTVGVIGSESWSAEVQMTAPTLNNKLIPKAKIRRSKMFNLHSITNKNAPESNTARKL